METFLRVIAVVGIIFLYFYSLLKRRFRVIDKSLLEDKENLEIEDEPLFEEERAIIVDMHMNLRNFGKMEGGPNKYHRLKFLVDFQLNDGEIKTLMVSEQQYEKMSVGEFAMLMTQNGRFIDFGDKFAETLNDDHD